MKSTIALFLFSFVMVTTVEAAVPARCKADFIELQNRQKTKLKPQRVITVTAETDLSKLLRVEQQVVEDYKKYVMAQIPDWGLEITSRQYWDKPVGETRGYRVIVDGGDEAVATFYYRLDIGMEDVVDRLLYYTWDNESPVREWVCDGY